MQKTQIEPRADKKPMIYAYSSTNPNDAGLLKVGYTTIGVQKRVKQQFPTLHPEPQYEIEVEESAMRADGTSFMDHDVHRQLKKMGIECVGGEWFRCHYRDVLSAIEAVRNRTDNEERRDQSFGMRPEQKKAVERTKNFYDTYREDETGRRPRFLWNCKMRFGKTFATYQLAKAMGMKRVLVLTFKPAVLNAWKEDLVRHIDFEGWQFYSRGEEYERLDKSRPIVCFGSFQDFMKLEKGQIKERYRWVVETEWDLVAFDEYHYGAWRENAKNLFAKEDEEIEIDTEKYHTDEETNATDERFLPITAKRYLFLTGTPFRALNNGDFIEEQIFSWTYQDEQKAKAEWRGEDNPYVALPRVIMMTYQMPREILKIAEGGQFNEFDLNEFFKAKEDEWGDSVFVHDEEVQKWLDFIQNKYKKEDALKSGARGMLPYSDTTLLSSLTHTLWFLPNVAACEAMHNLLMSRNNASFFGNYKVIVAAGQKAGIGADALPPVEKAMRGRYDEGPLETKTITLSCGKLTTGVSVRPWGGIFMLRNCKSPETYFQAAFRVQTPWTIKNPDKTHPNKEVIIKKDCYIFDFAPNRALSQIVEYSTKLNQGKRGDDDALTSENPEQSVKEFLEYLPVLAYTDGAGMKEIDAAGVMGMVMSGTNSTLLANKWKSALLVNVTDAHLKRLMDSPALLAALEGIEDFRNLTQDVETIINKSEKIKDAKREAKEGKEKKEMTQEEKEMKSRRKQIQEKLIKLATRIPIFMYLTDAREHCLKDVIVGIEPELFEKVTGLKVSDFEMLCRLDVFDSERMNEGVYYFKRYEDASLTYTGLNFNNGMQVGLWDKVIAGQDLKYSNIRN